MNPQLHGKLLKSGCRRIRDNVLLAPYTTFRIGGPATLFAEPASDAELLNILKQVRQEQAPYFFLGHGSNILISDAGFNGVVIRPCGDLEKIELRDGQPAAGPAAKLLDLTTFAAHHHLTGLETLSGIPGSVGGGLYMNAGAYGGEISDTLSEVDVLTPDNKTTTLRASEIKFNYRSAPLLADKIILESRYRLAAGNPENIIAEMRRVRKLRREKQPLEFPSAGSIFKRPPGDYAGRLIEAVNGKGTRFGGAMVSRKHAGIFINYQQATANDVVNLIKEIRHRVFAEFGILLETEIKPVGFANDPFEIQS